MSKNSEQQTEMTSRWRGELIVNFSARVMSAIRDSKIFTSSLVCRRSDCICIFSASATSHDAVSERRIPFSTCQRHGDTRRRSRQRVLRWRRMTGTHAYSLIRRGSSAASLTSVSAHSVYIEITRTESARWFQEIEAHT